MNLVRKLSSGRSSGTAIKPRPSLSSPLRVTRSGGTEGGQVGACPMPLKTTSVASLRAAPPQGDGRPQNSGHVHEITVGSACTSSDYTCRHIPEGTHLTHYARGIEKVLARRMARLQKQFAARSTRAQRALRYPTHNVAMVLLLQRRSTSELRPVWQQLCGLSVCVNSSRRSRMGRLQRLCSMISSTSTEYGG